MKIIILIFLSILSSNLFAKEDLEKIDVRGMSMRERIKLMTDARREQRMKTETVSKQSEGFMNELKKGISGLDEAKSKVFGQKHVSEINKEAGIQDNDSFTRLKGAMTAEDGEVTEYRKIGSQNTLNDNLVKEEYIIEYKNGKKQTVELLYIKPTISGGFKLMEVNVRD